MDTLISDIAIHISLLLVIIVGCISIGNVCNTQFFIRSVKSLAEFQKTARVLGSLYK